MCQHLLVLCLSSYCIRRQKVDVAYVLTTSHTPALLQQPKRKEKRYCCHLLTLCIKEEKEYIKRCEPAYSNRIVNYFKTGKCLLLWTDCTSAIDVLLAEKHFASGSCGESKKNIWATSGLKSVHLHPNDRLVSTQHPSLPNMSDNAFTSLMSGEHAYPTVMAVALCDSGDQKDCHPTQMH